MQERGELRRGMVLEPLRQPGTEQRLCVLLDDVDSAPVRVQVARRERDGHIALTGQQFMVPLAALDLLRPIAGLSFEV